MIKVEQGSRTKMLERADKLLVQLGYASSRTLAQKLIDDAKVNVNEGGNWRCVTKSSEKLDQSARFRVEKHEDQRFASRAGLKLDAAITSLQLDLNGMRALDIGQSTGGFTDCLLQHGCSHVTGIEVGHGQLLERLRQDSRVRCIEGANARDLKACNLSPKFNVAVIDVSFISQSLILPELPAQLESGAFLLSLVKPQFEVGPNGIGKGGLVKNVELYRGVEQKLTKLIQSLGFSLEAYFESAIKGGDGNREFIAFARLE